MVRTKKTVLLGLGLVVLASVLLTKENDAYAQTHTISVTTSGTQNIDVMGNRENTAVSSDEITVSTTCKSGYNFTMTTSVDSNDLYLDGDEANNSEGAYLTPADGITTLSGATNTWGYFYDGSTIPTASNVFSPVPTLGNTAVIRTPLDTPSETDISDNFSIYYGVSVSDSLVTGTYKMKQDAEQHDGVIVYQATIADACMRYTVNFDPTDTYSGSAVTGTGTMVSQSIYEGVATVLDSNTFTAPAGYEFVGWNTAQDGSGTMYPNGASVTDIAAVGESITLYAMWSDCANGICYQANGSNVVGTMGKQSVTANTAAPLLASNFSRTGFGFAGWSDVPDSATNPNAKFYGPMEDYIVPASSMAHGVKLYAVWVESVGSLQDATKVAELCGTGAGSLTQAPTDGTANLSSVSALTDQRDNQTYAIAKLADGKCWMIENLRLESQYTVGNNQTDPSVTNASLSQGYDSSFIGLAEPESADFSDSTTANSLYTIETGVEGKNTISGSKQGSRFPRYNNNNTSQRAEDTTNAKVNTYSYGNYYTWHAVIADTTHYTSGNHNATSICPTGWHIPTGNTSGEYYTLNTNANAGSTSVSTGLRSYPTNFLYSGNFTPSSANGRGVYGVYWSFTVRSASYSYSLTLGSTYVHPSEDNFYKYSGNSARCVAGQ